MTGWKLYRGSDGNKDPVVVDLCKHPTLECKHVPASKNGCRNGVSRASGIVLLDSVCFIVRGVGVTERIIQLRYNLQEAFCLSVRQEGENL